MLASTLDEVSQTSDRLKVLLLVSPSNFRPDKKVTLDREILRSLGTVAHETRKRCLKVSLCCVERVTDGKLWQMAVST
jgi:hypothetical protein